MSLESEQKYSMEELRQRNRPMQQQAVQSPAPMPQAIVMQCAMPQETEELLSQILYREEDILSSLERVLTQLRALNQKKELTEIHETLKQVETLMQPVGKKKEKRSWRLHFQFLKIHISPMWWLLLPAGAALLAAWYSLEKLWSAAQILFR